MTELTLGAEPTTCWDAPRAPDESLCSAGELELTVSRSGATRVMRCPRHAQDYRTRMDALEARLQRDYPGYDTPGSPPPRWFDPLDAGEHWDDEY